MNNNGKKLGQQIDTRIYYGRYDKMEILKKTNGRCAACGKKLKVEELDKKHPKHPDREVMTIDHVIPLNRGGWNVPSNQLPLCYDCNQEKGNTIYIPSWFYTAMVDNPILDKITDNFSEWFQKHIKENFHIEQYPMIAPKHNLILDITPAGYRHKKNRKQNNYIADTVLTWEYMGKNYKQEILDVTHIPLRTMKRMLASILDMEICGTRDKKRMMAVYVCRKKTTGKILTAAGVMYDEQAGAAAIYAPWIETSNHYKSCIVWSLVTALHGALGCGGYTLKDIVLIVPGKQRVVLDEINNRFVTQLANMKKKTLYGHMKSIRNEEETDPKYIMLRISENRVTGDPILDNFRAQFREKLKQKENMEK